MEVPDRSFTSAAGAPPHWLVEGDNLHALPALGADWTGGVDTIYIDPPYNTGSTSWRYNNKFFSEDDADRHRAWLQFMRARLELAVPLLKPGGILVVAIDDYEVHVLRLLLDELLGEDNRLATIVVKHKPGGRQDDQFFATEHEYMLVYARDATVARVGFMPYTRKKLRQYKYEDAHGRYKLREFRRSGSNSRKQDRPGLWYPIYVDPATLDLSLEPEPGWVEVVPRDTRGTMRVWRWGPETFQRRRAKYIHVQERPGPDGAPGYVLKVKERMDDRGGTRPTTLWDKSAYSAVNGTRALKEVFPERAGQKIFEYPKSPHLVRDILRVTSPPDGTILDFFAGSGTTGQAVLELNREDGGSRRFVLCVKNELGPRQRERLTRRGASPEEMAAEGVCRKVCYPRLARLMQGHAFQGRVRELLFERKVTWTVVKNARRHVLDPIEELKAAHRAEYARFEKRVEDGIFRFYGVREIATERPGFGENLRYFRVPEHT